MSGIDRFRRSNFNAIYGELLGVHKTKRRLSETVLIPAVLLSLLFFEIITYLAAEDFFALPLCVGIPLVMFAAVICHLLKTRTDELKICENGFTYKSNGNLKASLWKEIAQFHYSFSRSRDQIDVEMGRDTIESVEKLDGETISFTIGLSGREILEAEYKRFKWAPKRRRKVRRRSAEL